MALVTSAQFPGITPDILAAQQQGLAVQQQRIKTRALTDEQANRQKVAEQAQSQLETRQRALGVGNDPTQDTQEQATARLIATDPKSAQDFLKSKGVNDQSKREEVSRFAEQALRITDPSQLNEFIKQRASIIANRGGDPKDTLSLLNESPESQRNNLKGLQQIALTSLQREDISLKRDVLQQKKDKLSSEGKAVSEVQSSKILPGGLVQIVRKDGTTEVLPAAEADAELVKQAETRGAELQGLRAGERKEAANASKSSIDAFKGLSKVRKNIINMDEGIRLLNEGAGTGAIQSRLPSIRSASVKLDNLRGRLGLDVIGATTFGALSESELAFALDTALPKGLGEEALKSWLAEKRDAQAKVAENLEEAAIFLGTPGNNIADFIKIKKAEKEDQGNTQLPQGVSEDDITETMRANSMTRQQVLDRIGGQ